MAEAIEKELKKLKKITDLKEELKASLLTDETKNAIKNANAYVKNAVTVLTTGAESIREALWKNQDVGKKIAREVYYIYQAEDFMLMFTKYNLRVLGPYMRLIDAMLDFIVSCELAKKIESGFVKILTMNLTRAKQDLDEYHKLADALLANVEVTFKEMKTPKEMADMFEKFAKDNRNTLDRLGQLISEQQLMHIPQFMKNAEELKQKVEAAVAA